MRWRARYYDAAGKQHSQHFARRIDAQQWLDSVTTAVGTGSYVDPARSKTLVRVVAAEWLAGKLNLKETTRVRYENALSVHVLPRWGDTPLVAIEHAATQAWLAELIASGQAGASVRKIHGVFSAILDLAVRDKRLPANPTKGVNLPRAKSRRRRYLTADEVELLAAEAGRPPVTRAGSELEPAYAAYGLAIYVLAYCGLRWSEFAALRVDGVDLMRGRLQVGESVTELNGGRLLWGQTKSYEARSVPIPHFLRDELAPHLAGRSGRDLLFTTVNGEVLRNRNARRSWFDRAVTAIGQPGLTPHELRHTTASLAVSAGANVKAVQRMLGHASAAMTLDIYADLFDSDLDAVADRLDETRSAARDRVRANGALVRLR
ncbi:MAG: site-specific integrase [Pseudonocardiales bacterium]|nr:MAG: site-specific integrase [Pseudonocardiales bacterium]